MNFETNLGHRAKQIYEKVLTRHSRLLATLLLTKQGQRGTVSLLHSLVFEPVPQPVMLVRQSEGTFRNLSFTIVVFHILWLVCWRLVPRLTDNELVTHCC